MIGGMFCRMGGRGRGQLKKLGIIAGLPLNQYLGVMEVWVVTRFRRKGYFENFPRGSEGTRGFTEAMAP